MYSAGIVIAVLFDQHAHCTLAAVVLQCSLVMQTLKIPVPWQIRLFYEVRDNLGEGMRFYMSLQEAVRTLLQQTSDFCMTRRMQRDEHLQVGCRAIAEVEWLLHTCSRLAGWLPVTGQVLLRFMGNGSQYSCTC